MSQQHVSRLPTSMIGAYALPGLPLAVATLPVYVFIPTLYGQEFGLELATIGAILLAVRFLDAVSDPIIGYLSDHTNSRFGRRKPWFICATPFMMISLFMLFTPPVQDVDATYLLMWSLLLTVAWTGVMLPYSSWAAELTQDYHERTRITSFRESCVLIGTMIAASLPVVMTQFGYASLREHAYGIMVFVAALLPITVVVCGWVVPDVPRAQTSRLPLQKGIRLLVDNQPFRRLLLAYLINATANGLPASLFILFVTYRLEMPEAYGSLLFIYFLSGISAVPLWYAVSKRLSKHKTWCFAMLIAIAAFVWTPFLVGPGDYTTFLVITIVSGLAVGADLVLPPSIQADVVDMDTLKSGEQRTGLYFALWGMATKLALGLAVGIAFPLLDMVNFNADALSTGVTNSPESIYWLAMIYAFVPVLFKCGAVLLIWNFPLSQERQREVQRSIGMKSI